MKPMDEAPKDGTEVLAWFPELGWQPAVFSPNDPNAAGGWSTGFDYYGSPPTCWVYLPPKPGAEPMDEFRLAFVNGARAMLDAIAYRSGDAYFNSYKDDVDLLSEAGVRVVLTGKGI